MIEVCSKIHVLKRSQILLKQERKEPFRVEFEDARVSEYSEGWEIGSAKVVHRVVWEPGEASGGLNFLW